MIIVITKGGNEYINDKLVISVAHARKLKKVYVESPDHQTRAIHDVEQIRYYSDTTQITIEEDGSEVKKLKDQLKAKDAKFDELHKYTDRMRAIVLNYEFTHPELFDETITKLKKDHPKLFEDDSPKVNPGD
jgi:uncharacterized protein YdcH (DUF465 family)